MTDPREPSLPFLPFALPDIGQLTVPLQVSVPAQASVLFETKTSGHEQVIGALALRSPCVEVTAALLSSEPIFMVCSCGPGEAGLARSSWIGYRADGQKL